MQNDVKKINISPTRKLKALEGLLGGRKVLAFALGVKIETISHWHTTGKIPKSKVVDLAMLSQGLFTPYDFMDGEYERRTLNS